MVVVIPPQEPDQVLDTLHTVGVGVVNVAVIDTEVRAGRLNKLIIVKKLKPTDMLPAVQSQPNRPWQTLH